ncbi:unnamed protein product [Rotaria sordida]|uniref:Protein NO VEIN C-terminal domain-containing protein n=1 Tax=Rotaria sordida TaxID=392033 RepID=A0A819JDQ2_9BILA|nr:unnamed protein product [Rotaria sordida]
MPDNNQHRQATLLVCKYRKLQMISPSINQIYWQFKDLFRMLGCQCVVSISDIYSAIYSARYDKNNFYDLGDGETILTENGIENMISLFQYFESLILICVTEHDTNTDLYQAIITNKHQTAPYGSREDLEWRFSFTCNKLSIQLKKLTGIQDQHRTTFLLTIDRKLISMKSDHIIYACLETKIIQNLSRDFGKRYFVSPVITRTCPLVLAAFEIDYVERRGKVKWTHINHNLEFHLEQLTQIFQNALGDRQLEVAIAKYAATDLYLCDTCAIDSIDDENNQQIDKYAMETEYPFWVFDKTVLLCTGRNCTVERDPEENTFATIAADRIGEDRIYRNRVQTQNHRCKNETPSSNWMDPTIVDSTENIRIGHNAEHFFFVYLQKLYGKIDVTPTKNWRSSNRLIVYPQYRRNVDDSVGYDIELHDTQEHFVQGTGSTTKTCYFEVKGTSGSFDKIHTEFHISQNEFETCQAIANDARRREHEEYFIVIIENCLDSEKIALGTIINWSSFLNAVKRMVNSYRCTIASPPTTNSAHTNNEMTENAAADHQQNQGQRQSTASRDNKRNSMPQAARSNDEPSSSNRNNPPAHQNQQQQNRQCYGRGRGWNRNSQYPNTRN